MVVYLGVRMGMDAGMFGDGCFIGMGVSLVGGGLGDVWMGWMLDNSCIFNCHYDRMWVSHVMLQI